jgi:hypothetical protein
VPFVCGCGVKPFVQLVCAAGVASTGLHGDALAKESDSLKQLVGSLLQSQLRQGLLSKEVRDFNSKRSEWSYCLSHALLHKHTLWSTASPALITGTLNQECTLNIQGALHLSMY